MSSQKIIDCDKNSLSKSDENSKWYGFIEMDPLKPIIAGSYNTWKFTYTVGRYGLDNGGRIRLLFKLPSDMGRPQVSDSKGDHYVTATTSNPNVATSITYMPMGGKRPWMKILEIVIKGDTLDEGDKIYITLGDKSGGSKGQQAQTFIESDFKLLTEVECFQTGTWVELESSPITSIIAAEPYRIVALTPSKGVVNEKVDLLVKCEDHFGNPSASYYGNVTISIEQINEKELTQCSSSTLEGKETYCFTKEDKGCHRFEGFSFKETGMYRFKIEGENLPHPTAVSNIININDKPKDLKHYWGDLHAQYNNSTGTGSVEEAFHYARDAAGIDFTGHQPNDFLLYESGWEEAKGAVKKYHKPGKFIPFLGYEWSGNTPGGGDRNVHFLGDDGPLHRTSHWHVTDKSDVEMDRYPLDNLYQSFEGKNDVFLVPHVGGRRCDISRYFNHDLEPVIEICSVHGRFEWLLHEALENGYTVGVIGGSDDHTGRPGAAYPTSNDFGTRGGLAGIYAKELTREGIYKALKSRHCYATTGERIWLSVETLNGKMMGDIWTDNDSPVINIQAAGTKPIEKLEIIRNQDVVYSHPIFQQEDFIPERIRVEWGGASIKGRGRETDWNGLLSIENGQIKDAQTFAFDHSKQGIRSQNQHALTWESTTSGDHDGLILDLDTCGNTIINFETKFGKDRIEIRDLLQGPIRKECGGVDQYYLFSLQPKKSGPMTMDINWKDPHPLEGRNAYWIRLVQEDGEMAWSSPLYFNKK
ncbi:DUF3604 domain-containing protein [Pseudalkalibacillus decolorationis]|uniref:DUF3604 domain-containing protein n=1 Tax=Pseudalkalibacillus decolorationis TaxID=163879 RepID=UPI0021489EE7|nr:DUF3604 domain-containing protein [Pseudalkalibacillus decolorationis]